ncbi:MAG: regulatory protein RecX [Prevotella sp.]
MIKQTKQMDEQQALGKLAAMCSKAEHSSGEIIKKMRQWQLPEDVQQRILQRLTDDRYVDNVRFCRSFVREKICFDKWGRRKIEQALYIKGVAKTIYSPILDEVDDGEYVRALRPLITAKSKSISAASEYELNGKLIRFALGRGFGMDIIRQCIDSDDKYDIPEDND